MFGTSIHTLWSAARYNAPYLSIIYQNGAWSRPASPASGGHRLLRGPFNELGSGAEIAALLTEA
jgi:hypothetical protein